MSSSDYGNTRPEHVTGGRPLLRRHDEAMRALSCYIADVMDGKLSATTGPGPIALTRESIHREMVARLRAVSEAAEGDVRSIGEEAHKIMSTSMERTIHGRGLKMYFNSDEERGFVDGVMRAHGAIQ